jgi:hypothetical protein
MALIQKFLIQSWWVILFTWLCYMCYEQGLRKRNADFQKLEKVLAVLKMKRQSALAVQEDLILQMNSQSDPDWVELTLMKGLGLVPEGQKKIYFSNEAWAESLSKKAQGGKKN